MCLFVFNVFAVFLKSLYDNGSLSKTEILKSDMQRSFSKSANMVTLLVSQPCTFFLKHTQKNLLKSY